MKAIVFTKYGPPDVLALKEVEKPVPRDNEVLIRVHATTVTAGDCEVRRFEMPMLLWLPIRLYIGLIKPRKEILGQELAGVVERAGKGVTRFREGDEVFGACGFGACAEYVCIPEGGALAVKPANVSFEEAAALPVGGLNALYFLRKGNVRAGQKVLINGAGGSIGTMAIQLAKSFGAEVTAVDSTGKLDMLRDLGADRAIDYTREDITVSGETYDVIFDVASKSSFSRIIGSLKKKGVYLLANLGLSLIVRGLWTSMTGSRKVLFGLAGDSAEDMAFLGELAGAGKIKPVVDRRYPLQETAEAHRYVEQGLKKGNVVIDIVPPGR